MCCIYRPRLFVGSIASDIDRKIVQMKVKYSIVTNKDCPRYEKQNATFFNNVYPAKYHTQK